MSELFIALWQVQPLKFYPISMCIERLKIVSLISSDGMPLSSRLSWTGKIDDYPMENYPDYEPGKPPRTEKLRKLDYAEEMPKIWGQNWGETGIGRLREVALVKPTEHELNPLFVNHPEYFLMISTLRTGKKPDINFMIEQVEDYGKLLHENGVKVHWLQYPDVMGAYGPLRKLFVAGNLGLVVRGGAILFRFGQASFLRGTEFYAQQLLAQINCPIMFRPTGKAILEMAWPFAAENVLLGSYGIACNQEAIDQIRPILAASGIELIMGNSNTIADTYSAGGEFHLDGVLQVVDSGVGLMYPNQLDYSLYVWLKEHNFRLVEVSTQEHLAFCPENGMILDAGKVIQPAGAKETNKKLRDQGVDVIEMDTSGIGQMGFHGIRCITLPLVRDPGPTLEEIKK